MASEGRLGMTDAEIEALRWYLPRLEAGEVSHQPALAKLVADALQEIDRQRERAVAPRSFKLGYIELRLSLYSKEDCERRGVQFGRYWLLKRFDTDASVVLPRVSEERQAAETLMMVEEERVRYEREFLSDLGIDDPKAVTWLWCARRYR